MTHADQLAARHSHVYPPKYDWTQHGFFSDGSVLKEEASEACPAPPQLVGTAVWCAKADRTYRILPNGQDPTNTINCAKAAAIYHIVTDICPPTEPARVFTDSQVCLQRLEKMMKCPS